MINNKLSNESITYKKEQLLGIILEDLHRLLKKAEHYSKCNINDIRQDDIIAMQFDTEQLLRGINELNGIVMENKAIRKVLIETEDIDKIDKKIDKYLFAKFLKNIETDTD